MKKGIIDVLKNEMSNFTFPVIINNLPSIDGLLCGQRQVIWGMNKAHMNSNGQFYKMLKATGRIFDYYVLGDSGLTSCMKNMGNNYSLNKYLMPKGSFGNKNLRDSDGSAARYIECKLSPYAEYMLEGINKNAVPMKLNYDATEHEPIILPSKIPNILTNLRMSIAVSEANKMPSHNMEDACNSIISYIKTGDIDKSIELLKVPDLPTGGQIIYDKDTFNSIYKTGKGSFINLGKYRYDKKENMIVIYEIPYCTNIDNIYDEINKNITKFQSEVASVHDGSDKNGLALQLYLKKDANIDTVIKKLREYTSFEKPFSCNFVILDLDGKTPRLMSLEDIITKWLTHRRNCIKNEYNYSINEKETLLQKLYALRIIDEDIDKAVEIIKTSKKEEIALKRLKEYFGLTDSQAEYIATIKLINLNEEWLKTRINNITPTEQEVTRLKAESNDKDYINNLIISQLEEVKSKFGQPRKTEIIYEDTLQEISKEEILEDYNCRLILTKEGYIKKHLKQSDNHKLKDNDYIIQEIISNNKDTILLISDKGNRYKISCNDLEVREPSKLPEYIPNLIDLEEGEHIITIASVSNDNKGYILSCYENGKVAKVPVDKFMSANKKLLNCYNTESKLLDIKYIKNDVDILMVSSEGKVIIFNTSSVNDVASRNSQGVVGIKLDDNNICIGCIIDVSNSDKFEINTLKGKNKQFDLEDIAPTNKPNEERSLFRYLYSNKRGNQGNFVMNLRNSNDTIVFFGLIKF